MDLKLLWTKQFNVNPLLFIKVLTLINRLVPFLYIQPKYSHKLNTLTIDIYRITRC